VIDDDHTVLEVGRLILEEMGYTALCAETGEEAIEIVKNYDGDIAVSLLDIKLTDTEGAEVYHAIKNTRPDMKVLVCSGCSLEGPAQLIIDAGADGFIQKPFAREVLSDKLNELLKSAP
jgi:DNA-binding response OmpR family regulator